MIVSNAIIDVFNVLILVKLIGFTDTDTWDFETIGLAKYEDIPDISNKIDTAGIGLEKIGTTIKTKLNSETSLGTIGTTDKLYAVGVDSNGKLCVNVPYDSTTITNTATYYLLGALDNIGGLNKHNSAYISVQSDSIVDGETKLTLGNNTTSSVGSKHGVIRLYGINSFYTDLLTSNGLNSDITIHLPNQNGTIALTADIPNPNLKQDVLVSGTNIKTINNVSILGSGNLNLADYQVFAISNLVDGSTTGSVRGIGTAAESSSYTIGQYALAEGYGTTASGNASHAEGHSSTASGLMSHAEGYNTTASQNYTHAEGIGSAATYEASHAEGFSTTASGYTAHAEGANTIASGESSHAEGSLSQALAQYSHAGGRGTYANGTAQTVIGAFNTIADSYEDISPGNRAFIIGNGTDNNNRSDALTVDWSGNVVIAGTLTDGNGRSLGSNTQIVRWTEV